MKWWQPIRSNQVFHVVPCEEDVLNCVELFTAYLLNNKQGLEQMFKFVLELLHTKSLQNSRDAFATLSGSGLEALSPKQ